MKEQRSKQQEEQLSGVGPTTVSIRSTSSLSYVCDRVVKSFEVVQYFELTFRTGQEWLACVECLVISVTKCCCPHVNWFVPEL